MTLLLRAIVATDDAGAAAELGLSVVSATGVAALASPWEATGAAGEAETFQWMETFGGELLLMSLATNRFVRRDAEGRLSADSPGPRPDGADGTRFRWRIR